MEPQDIQMEEEIIQEVTVEKGYARVDQHYKNTKKNRRKGAGFAAFIITWRWIAIESDAFIVVDQATLRLTVTRKKLILFMPDWESLTRRMINMKKKGENINEELNKESKN